MDNRAFVFADERPFNKATALRRKTRQKFRAVKNPAPPRRRSWTLFSGCLLSRSRRNSARKRSRSDSRYTASNCSSRTATTSCSSDDDSPNGSASGDDVSSDDDAAGGDDASDGGALSSPSGGDDGRDDVCEHGAFSHDVFPRDDDPRGDDRRDARCDGHDHDGGRLTQGSA